MSKEISLNPKKITKISDNSYLPEDKIERFCIFLDNTAKQINGHNLYNFKFGSSFITDEYLYKVGDRIFLAKVEGNKIIREQNIFDFSRLSQPDTAYLIRNFGVLSNHFLINTSVVIEKNDTVFCYDAIRKSSKVTKKNADGSTTELSSDLKDGNERFYTLWVSKNRGIIRVTKDEAYYNITYE
jgi:hypothetical protein